MKKLFLIFVYLPLAFLLSAQNVAGDVVFLSNEEYASFPAVDFDHLRAISKRTTVGLEKGASFSGIVSLVTPTPGNQGSQGSCTAWAVAYGALSTLAYDKFNQNMNMALRSPSFVFNLIVNGNDSRYPAYSTAGAVRFVADNGSCSLSDMPYNPSDASTMPTELQKFNAGLNTVGYGAIHDRHSTDKIKEAIYYGFPVVVAFQVTSSFDIMWSTDEAVWSEMGSNSRGGHAACIIGYDDSKSMFKVMNSWGTNGGDEGFFWVTYDMVSNGCFRELYVISEISEDVFPMLEGSDFICDEELYAVNNLPSEAEISWSCPTSNPSGSWGSKALVYQDVGSNTASFRRNTILSSSWQNPNCYSGYAKVNAKVQLPNGAFATLMKTVMAVTPEKPDIHVPQIQPVWQVNGTRTISIANSENLQDYRLSWSVIKPGGSVAVLGVGPSVSYTPTATGNHTFIVVNENGCGVSRADTAQFNVIPNFVIHTNNPASDILDVRVMQICNSTIDILSYSTNNVADSYNEILYDGDFAIEIAGELQGVLHKYDFAGSGGIAQISIADLLPGTYFVRLLIDNILVETSQFYVE